MDLGAGGDAFGMDLDNPDTFGIKDVEFGDTTYNEFEYNDTEETSGNAFTENPTGAIKGENLIDIPFEDLEEEEYGGISDEDAQDYQTSKTTAKMDESHELSSPFANGLLALRVEMAPDDGGVKAESLKQTEFYKNHKEIFKDVIIEKNTNENDDDVVCNICLDGE